MGDVHVRVRLFFWWAGTNHGLRSGWITQRMTSPNPTDYGLRSGWISQGISCVDTLFLFLLFTVQCSHSIFSFSFSSADCSWLQLLSRWPGSAVQLLEPVHGDHLP